MTLLVIVLLSPNLYASQTKPADVESRLGTVRSNLPMRASFPKKEGRYPVIMLCHGLRGSRDGLLPLSRTWAAAGYVVLQPSFEDSAQRVPREEVWNLRGRGALSSWRSRVADVKWILDNPRALEAAFPGLRGRADWGVVGVGGHSMGAHTSQLIAGLKLAGRSFADSRPKAFLLISPQGQGAALREDSWQDMTRPTMSITGSQDFTPKILESAVPETPETRQKTFLNSPPGDKYLLFIEGAGHDFGGINRSGRKETATTALVRQTGLAFWDAYLKSDVEARRFLQTSPHAGALPAHATLTSR